MEDLERGRARLREIFEGYGAEAVVGLTLAFVRDYGMPQSERALVESLGRMSDKNFRLTCTVCLDVQRSMDQAMN